MIFVVLQRSTVGVFRRDAAASKFGSAHIVVENRRAEGGLNPARLKNPKACTGLGTSSYRV